MKKQFFTKAIALSIIICSANLLTNAQAPQIHSQKCLGGSDDEFAQNIIKLSDGNYLTCGATNSTDGNFNATHGDYDAYLVKTNGAGNIIWKKTYGGSGYDAFYNMVETSNGDVYAIGSTNSNDGQVSGNHGGEGYGDVWLVKVNSQGHFLSQHCYGGSGDEFALGINITAQHKIIFAAATSSNDGEVSTNHGDFDGWIVELKSSGAIKFSTIIGGAGYDDFISVAEINGNLLAAGTTDSVASSDANFEAFEDAHVAMLNHSGNIIYHRTYGGSGSDAGNAMVITPDGNAVLAGHIASVDGDGTGNSGFNLWAWKIDVANNGDILWKSFLGIQNYFSTGFNMTATRDGGFVMVGSAGTIDGPPFDTWDGYVVKVDASGNKLWNLKIGGSNTDAFNGVVEEDNGSILTAGLTASNDGDVIGYRGGPEDAWLVNLDGNGCQHHRDANDNLVADNFSLNSFPNPFSNSTTISFSLTESQDVSIKIFDLNGKLIETLADNIFEEGEHSIEWSANKVNAGIYFLQFQSAENLQTEKLIVTK